MCFYKPYNLKIIFRFMMIPRLQIKRPYLFNYNKIDEVDIKGYMSTYGIVKGISESWERYVREMYENFEATISPNDGIEAVIQNLKPAVRKLRIKHITDACSSIECQEGGGLIFLTLLEDESMVLSFGTPPFEIEDDYLDLSYFDSADIAEFIAATFKAYRTLTNRFRNFFSKY